MFDVNQLSEIFNLPLWLIAVVFVWSAVWKGFALWKSSKNNHLAWFVAILVINTLGILEILYYFLFSELKLGGKKLSKKLSKNNLKSKDKNNKRRNLHPKINYNFFDA